MLSALKGCLYIVQMHEIYEEDDSINIVLDLVNEQNLFR